MLLFAALLGPFCDESSAAAIRIHDPGTRVFSHETALFFSTEPHEVCEGLLPEIVVNRTIIQSVKYGISGGNIAQVAQ